MLRLGIVGDLSLQDPNRLQRVMADAFGYSDIVIQLGDMHPGYQVIRTYLAMQGGKKIVLVIKGNHDVNISTELPECPIEWYRAFQFEDGSPACYLIGMDNSADKISPTAWNLFQSVPNDGRPVLLFLHKPLSTIVLSDGSESNHTMEEAGPNADARKLREWVKARQSEQDVMLIHGHYHGWTCQLNDYAFCLIEGRGGAAGTGPGELGWTQIYVTKEGLSVHRVDL